MDNGTIISCESGAYYSGGYVPISSGGVTVQFTETHTATSGSFRGKFHVTRVDEQTTFPSGNERIIIKVWD